MRLSARVEVLLGGRVLRVCLTRRWMLGALWFERSGWLAVGPLRVLTHTRRVYWEEP